MHRLRVQEFLDQLPPDEQQDAFSIIQTIHDSFPSSFMSNLQTESVQDFLHQYEDYVQKRCRENYMYAFWTTYLELVELLLLFLRGTREGNWELHLSAIRDMIPWFFAYGRINYSRYLPIYYLEMKDLPSTHPFVHSHLSNGKFAVKRHDDHGFALTACDQIIEQTYNRDSKTRGGLTGITLNKGAVRRWILSYPARAAIASSCFNMASTTSNKQSSKPERIVSQAAVDEQAIQDVMLTIQEFSSPFSHEDDKELVNICSGKVAPEDVRTDLFSANTKGEECFKTFVNERLIEEQKDIFDKLSLPTGKTFSDIDKRLPVKATQRATSLKKQRDLLVRLLMIAQEKELDLEDVMQYPMSSVPNALADVDGSMAKTNKAVLLHEVEKTFGGSTACTDVTLKDNVVVIVDAMVMIQQQRQFPETFGEFADNILRQLVSLARKYKAKRVNFVGDRYREMSIKQTERERRSMKGETKFLISRPTQKMPKMMKKFLASGTNKENLLMFLVEYWKNLTPETLGNIQLYATQREACFKFSTSADGSLTVENITELHSDHEEADTRMLLHSVHASKSPDVPTDIVISSVDTDVFVLSLWMATQLSQRLIMYFMCGNKSRLIDLTAISTEMGDTIAEALVGLHPFTGCDSVSAFKGKGKVKTLKLLMTNEDYQRIFCELGRNWKLPYPLYKEFERFVCDVYGWKDCDDVSAVRYKCYRVGNVSDTSLPPNRDSLKLHIDRANYHVKVHRSCAQQHVRAPHPKDHGWKLEGSQLSLSWSTLPIAPDNVMTNMYCNCKKTICNSNRCSCKKAGILCTAVCRCELCDNRAYPHGSHASDDSGNDQSD